ncbi:DegT/DnrJ/EryC1/StrS family aminotransferase [Candidatus Allofournierella merdipullorum]|uniref:DegT/DnrJ/EryC1/StrS family aminotransferase n=1 Tax=Candidatus Allofournierella merdipullorum TaxID=2838595 RepID=UPI00374EC80E
MMQFRDLQKQYEVLKPQIDAAVQKVCAQADYISGWEVRELEQQLAEYVGVKHCITCANGTDALSLVLMAWGIGPGDAALVPDFTFFASGETVAYEGATPLFVDVDERTFNLDPDKLEEKIIQVKAEGKYNLRAVVAVDLFGLPADYTRIEPICKKYGLLLLEDGAQGFGGTINGRRVGSFGDAATTSFFPAKPLGCYGDGGAIFTNNDEWADLIRSYAVHGKGSMKYDNVRLGMNSRLDTIQAAILQVKLKAFAEYELDAVEQVSRWYDEALKDSGLVLPYRPEGFSSSWAQYTVQLPQGVDRDALQAKLKEQGIPTMVYYPRPMHQQKAFAGTDSAVAECPVTERLCKTVLSLPMYPYLLHEDIKADEIIRSMY